MLNRKSPEVLEIAKRRFVTTSSRPRKVRADGSLVGERGSYIRKWSILGYIKNALGFTGSSFIDDFDTFQMELDKDEMIWNFYHGIQLPYLQKLPSETIEDFQCRQGLVTHNFFKLLIDIISQNYKEPPNRRFLDKSGSRLSDEETDTIKQVYRKSCFDTAMLDVDRYCCMHGECLIRPIYENGGLEWAIVAKPSYNLLIEVDEETNQNSIMAVVFREVVKHEGPNHNVNQITYRYQIWTDTEFAIYDDGAEVVREANRYGRIPYVYCTQTNNYAQRFKQPDRYEDAVANMELNDLTSLSNWSMRFAGMPITVISNSTSSAEDDFQMRPGHVINLGGEGNIQARLEFVAPQDRSQAFNNQIEKILEKMFRSNGINYVMSEGVKAGTSGITVEVSMAPVLAQLKERAKVTTKIENRVYDLLRVVASKDGGEKLPEVDYVDVEYRFSLSMRSAQDLLNQVQIENAMGIKDKNEVLQTLYPERFGSRDEADEYLKTLEEEQPDPSEMMQGGETNQQGAKDERERFGGEHVNGRPNAGRSNAGGSNAKGSGD